MDIIIAHESALILMSSGDMGKSFLIHVSAETGNFLLELLRKQTFKRPNTFTLLSNCVTLLDACIHAVIIDDMREGIFFAKVVLRHKESFLFLDARPSDAIALAMVNHRPILVTEALMERVSLMNTIDARTKSFDTFSIIR